MFTLTINTKERRKILFCGEDKKKAEYAYKQAFKLLCFLPIKTTNSLTLRLEYPDNADNLIAKGVDFAI
jgi:hypothetical protein